MRISTLVPLIALPVAGVCDPLIDIPTARKLPFGTLKLEYASSFTGSLNQFGWIDLGIGKSFEADLRQERVPGGGGAHETADFMYGVIAALPGLSPGIAFGMQDIANTTQDGRQFYGVVTFREPTETFEGESPFDLTIGVAAGRKVVPFGGLSLPLTQKLRLLVEHNGYRAAGGFQFDLDRSLSIRLLYRGPSTLADLVYRSRF